MWRVERGVKRPRDVYACPSRLSGCRGLFVLDSACANSKLAPGAKDTNKEGRAGGEEGMKGLFSWFDWQI